MINNSGLKDSVFLPNSAAHFLTTEQRHQLLVTATKVIYRSPYGKDRKANRGQDHGGSL